MEDRQSQNKCKEAGDSRGGGRGMMELKLAIGPCIGVSMRGYRRMWYVDWEYGNVFETSV